MVERSCTGDVEETVDLSVRIGADTSSSSRITISIRTSRMVHRLRRHRAPSHFPELRRTETGVAGEAPHLLLRRRGHGELPLLVGADTGVVILPNRLRGFVTVEATLDRRRDVATAVGVEEVDITAVAEDAVAETKTTIAGEMMGTDGLVEAIRDCKSCMFGSLWHRRSC